jgi:hypothetical protein
LTGTYPNPTIANDAVTSAKIADGEVKTADLEDGAVTTDKLADGIDVSKLAVTHKYLIVGNSSDQGSLLAPGSPGQVLTIDATSGEPTWADLSAAGGWAVGGNSLSTGPGILGTTQQPRPGGPDEQHAGDVHQGQRPVCGHRHE